MPILKLEIFQNSKSQKCKLWGQPFLEKVYILIFFYDGFPKCVCKEKMEKITMYFTGTQILLILGISCIYEMDRRLNNLFKKLFSKIYIFFCKF